MVPNHKLFNLFSDIKRINSWIIFTALLAGTLVFSGCNSIRKPDYPGVIPRKDYALMGSGSVNAQQMGQFLSSINGKISTSTAKKFAEIYIQEARAENVNPDIAFVQMCLETDYLRYGGQVLKEQYNFCGLGATDDGSEGATFNSVREGVRAHIQHLKAYGSTRSLNKHVVDPRFELVKRGSAPTIKELAGKWATDPQYAEKLARLLQRLRR